MFPVLLLVFVQFVSVSHGTEEHRVCLSCPRVSRQRDCQTFAEIWANEFCSTELFLLLNGSTVIKFGYSSATDCTHSDVPASPHIRSRRTQNTDITMCHECCTGNLCNRKLCGITRSNSTNLACLIGEESSGVPSTSITYCSESEQCYAAKHNHNTRPHRFHYGTYGCASQAVCVHLLRPVSGSSGLCRGCCSEDGCNAYLCHGQVPDDLGSTWTTESVMGTTTQSATLYTDCWDLRERGGYQQTGVYDIYPAPAHSRLRVRCDMTTDGGGWIVLQKRYDGSLNFNRTFQEYEQGFGDVAGEHWVGLEAMHMLTSQGGVRVRVDLCAFNGSVGYAVYNGFMVSGRNDTYRLNIGVKVNGNIYDGLRYHDGMAFQTTSRCAAQFRGGWWYDSCYVANLNGGLYNGGYRQGIVWPHFAGSGYSAPLRSSEIKIRPLIAPGEPTHPYICHP